MTDVADEPKPEATDRRWFAITAVGTFLLLALQYKNHWTPGGDSDFFISVARNLARGQGYVYGGHPVAISPPGWPIVLAGLMKVSASFAWLNLVQNLLLWAGLLLFYPITRTLAGPSLAAACVLATAVLHPVYPLGNWLHSEPLYLVLVNGATLAALAFAGSMTRRRWLWLVAATLLIVGGVFVRWTGLFHWLVIAAALSAGVGTLHAASVWTRTALPVVVAGLFVLVAFQSLTKALQISTDPVRATVASVEGKASPTLPTATRPATQPTTRQAPATRPRKVQESVGHGDFLAAHNTGGRVAEFVYRLAALGSWVSWLLWYPTRFASGLGVVSLGVTVAGWVAAALFAVGWRRLDRRGRWLAGGVLAYVVTIALVWPNPNARYLVPIAPMALAVVLVGAASVGRRWPAIVLASVVLANVPLYAVDAYLARVPGAARQHFEAGDAASLVAACRVLSALQPTSRDVVVSERYVNFGRYRYPPHRHADGGRPARPRPAAVARVDLGRADVP